MCIKIFTEKLLNIQDLVNVHLIFNDTENIAVLLNGTESICFYFYLYSSCTHISLYQLSLNARNNNRQVSRTETEIEPSLKFSIKFYFEKGRKTSEGKQRGWNENSSSSYRRISPSFLNVSYLRLAQVDLSLQLRLRNKR